MVWRGPAADTGGVPTGAGGPAFVPHRGKRLKPGDHRPPMRGWFRSLCHAPRRRAVALQTCLSLHLSRTFTLLAKVPSGPARAFAENI